VLQESDDMLTLVKLEKANSDIVYAIKLSSLFYIFFKLQKLMRFVASKTPLNFDSYQVQLQLNLL